MATNTELIDVIEKVEKTTEPTKKKKLEWLSRTLHNKQNISRLAFMLGPWVAYFCVELMNKNNPFTSNSIDEVALNLLWYYLFFGLAWLAVGRRNLAAGGMSLLCFIVGLVNHYVLVFRGRVIFPCDLVAWRTAMNVAGDFDYMPDRTVWGAGTVLVAYLLLLIVVPRVRERQFLSRRVLLPLLAAVSIFIYGFFGTDILPSIGIYAQQWKTQQNGFLLNFMTSLSYSFVREPKGYSSEQVREVMQGYASESIGSRRPRNLIVIMNESFADLTNYKDLELNEDPMPFYRALKENTVKGTMYAPVTGGGTANVEFEYLTGDSLAFLPPATVAYQLYLYDGAPSLVSQANSLGYHTAAFHPYLSSGWNRTSVYQWLGFDKQYYEEDVENPEYIREYISDASDYEQIYRWTEESAEPDFIFNVTMQNHSGYNQGWKNLEHSVKLAGKSVGTSTVAGQYLSLIRESDNALRELIEHYSGSDEDTMIVFFGDHQPPLENDFYETLYGKKLDDRTTDETFEQYGVPFFIWANYDIPEEDNVKISSNYLGMLTAQLAGFPLTGYQQFLSDLHEELPVATTVGFMTKDSRIVGKASDLNEAQQELYRQYQDLAYAHLFEKRGKPDSFFTLQ